MAVSETEKSVAYLGIPGGGPTKKGKEQINITLVVCYGTSHSRGRDKWATRR